MEALKSKTKYCRIIRKRIRRKIRYFVQLIQEGYPPKKNRVVGNDTTVGLDIGPFTIAIVSNDYVNLMPLSNQKLDNYKKQIRKIQRVMDRSRRSTNSQNYNEDGTIKKGTKKRNYSNNYMRLKYRLNKIHRKLRINRNIAHEKLANLILSLGTDIRVEKLNVAGWAKRSKNTTRNKKNGKFNSKKRFGKSIASNAPVSLLLKINRKLQYEGKELKKINTFKCKASQYNHKTNTFKKKALNERIAIVGEEIIQRDIYSAFLIKNTNERLDKIDKSKCDSEWDKFLENYKIYLEA